LREGDIMMTVRLAKEIVVRVPNHIGVLAQISKLIADKGYNLEALSGSREGMAAVIRMVTEDNLRVSDALREKGFYPVEEDVIAVELPHKPGMLRRVAEDLARADVDIEHMYATAVGDRSLIVFSSSNNERALVALRS